MTSNKQPLPDKFYSKPFKYEQDNKEEIILLSRAIKTFNENEATENVPAWAGIHSLVSEAKLNIKKVGFLPLLPHSITKIIAVYTCLLNFKSVADKLDQSTLPIACDEDVFRLAVQIYLDRPESFNNIFPILGTFHLSTAALKCAGKFVRGSGIEDTFIESRIFGPKTLESLLTGGHYYRSFCGGEGLCLEKL